MITASVAVVEGHWYPVLLRSNLKVKIIPKVSNAHSRASGECASNQRVWYLSCGSVLRRIQVTRQQQTALAAAAAAQTPATTAAALVT
jgi:hypothetical protein